MSSFTIGLFGTGLDTYWPQFPGLRERLLGYQETVKAKLLQGATSVVDAGLVDTPDQARLAASKLPEARVDFAFLYVSTYALSSTVLPVAQGINAPFILLNLQPTSSRGVVPSGNKNTQDEFNFVDKSVNQWCT